MKHLTLLLTMAITLTGIAQQMPYNPDANGDDFVGVDDVLGVLGVFDTALMQPDLTCDYEGTELESALADLVSGNLILDSIYVEYLIMDTNAIFVPGCPDPVDSETILERSYMLTNALNNVTQEFPLVGAYGNYLGYYREFMIQWNSNNGEFVLYQQETEVGGLTSFNSYSQWQNNHQSFPLPEEWVLSENGIEVDWESSSWQEAAEILRIIPFWHEAE